MGEAPPSPTLQEAVRRHQAGELKRAKDLYKQAVAAAPRAGDPRPRDGQP